MYVVAATLGELTGLYLIFSCWKLRLKLTNNSTWYKVSYYKMTGLYFMSGGTKISLRSLAGF